MLARVTTFALEGLAPRRVWVEVDIRAGLPAFSIVGLGDLAVRESRERVRAAIQNSGFEFPARRITANLAPASMRKIGPGFDLALAVALLAASGQVPRERVASCAVFGELSLGGEVRPCQGALAVAEGTRSAGLLALILPVARAGEAQLVPGIEVVGVAHLQEVVEILRGERAPRTAQPQSTAPRDRSAEPDLADVRGQDVPREALEIAAAGGHNLLFEGSPGVGKTMLARRLPSILPPLSREEALEVTRIRSVAGLGAGSGLIEERPFRAPHHTISAPGLVGGGSVPVPGEATLAHHGVLFLDELSEFSRPALDALRQPMEDGRIVIVRGQRAALYPARFMLVAATNPCPCGYAGTDRCRCSEPEVTRHRRRLSGPLIDRLDLLVPVDRPTGEELEAGPSEASAPVRGRVEAARERQARRLAGTGALCNAHMRAGLLRLHGDPDPGARRALAGAYERGLLTARGHHRVLRVARTIADLAESARISAEHVITALSFRLAPAGWVGDERVDKAQAAS